MTKIGEYNSLLNNSESSGRKVLKWQVQESTISMYVLSSSPHHLIFPTFHPADALSSSILKILLYIYAQNDKLCFLWCGGNLKQYPTKGVYNCAGCDAPLYKFDSKFKSGCGWPAFFEEIPGTVVRHTDSTFGMKRTEIVCANCGGHLGKFFY